MANPAAVQTITIPIDTHTNGVQMRDVEAVIVNDIFAVHETPGFGGWTITHRPTGLCVDRHFQHKQTAIRCARAILPMLDWLGDFKAQGAAAGNVKGLIRNFQRDENVRKTRRHGGRR